MTAAMRILRLLAISALIAAVVSPGAQAQSSSPSGSASESSGVSSAGDSGSVSGDGSTSGSSSTGDGSGSESGGDGSGGGGGSTSGASGTGSASGSGGGDSPSGSGSPGDGSGGGGSAGDGSGGGSDGGASGGGVPGGGGPGGSGPGVAISDDGVVEHDHAVEAVQQQQAISLNALMAIVSQATTDRVIDVRLVLFHDSLLYQVKTLGSDGVVTNLYFYAATGAPVGRELTNADSRSGG